MGHPGGGRGLASAAVAVKGQARFAAPFGRP